MRAIVSGYYGFGNAGDEAILGGLVEGFRELCPQAELTVLSGNPAETIAEHGVIAVPRGLAFARRHIALSDVVISGGGGLLQDATSWRSPLYYLAIIHFAKWARRPVACIGQSIGPLKRPWVRSLLRRELARVDVVAVRDEVSRDTLVRLGLSRSIEISADLAFLLPRPTEAEIAAVREKAGVSDVREPVAAVALRRLPGAADDGGVRQVAAAVGRACGELGLRPLLIPMQPTQDVDLARSAAAAMAPNGAITAPAMRAREILALVASCRLMIAMRLHALIFAALCGIPPIAISYDPKVDGVMQQLGLRPAATLGQFSPDQLVRAIAETWSGRGNVSEMLAARAPRLRSLALRNVELALSLLPKR